MELIECRVCHRKLSKDQFIPDKRRKDGIDHRCHDCFNRTRKEQRQKIHNLPVMEGVKRCSKCKEEKSITDFSRNPKMRDGRANWCNSCHKEATIRRREKDPEYFKAIGKKRNKKLRLQTLTHYSKGTPTCACCGETEIMFLCIDHINGNGNAHRKTIPRGHYINQWLKNNRYPEGFQVLCHNCNMAKGFYGECPHETKRKAGEL